MNRAVLPEVLIIDDFIVGNNEHTSYEIYLTELLNNSQFFLEKGGSNYCWTANQSHGECDAVSTYYSIDFKLLGSESAIKAESILSPQKCLVDGVLYDLVPKMVNGMNVSLAYNLLHSLSLADLITIDSGGFFNISKADRSDVKGLLNTLKTKKNILLFSVDFIIRTDVDETDCLDSIKSIYSERLHSALEFRQLFFKNQNIMFDTFFAFVFDGFLHIFDCNKCYLKNVDKILLSKSDHFMTLYNFLTPTEKQYLKVKRF